ncbi:ABC transporter ATP-binding protein [Leucobacter luti]|uniref:Amino acid/amide ABC transporter ATP-binding protein 2 (HAAT family) n=1 Tax=Leucobacter luti TaxID=340320 RepID=A0A4Q7TZW3_9MICO|nr:ATP-binding cassette domain-containing protein [Leucobacter luti]MBL3698780.1 ATP-binding cassette domain-containing protein [Leucobacter luti]RZT66157.1 amino acid/amide ABC transporter ATP-binding protein 2 (HAAT family) [Leucobacter luti]
MRAPSAPERLLTVAGLRVSYRGIAAVTDVDFHVDAGELVGIIGPNGAGKSSTMHAIVGAVRASATTLEFAGRGLAGQPTERIARRGIALVQEGHNVFGRLTVRENLRLGSTARASSDGLAEDLRWVLSLFPILDEFADRQAGLLSGGQQQQLAIGRALLAAPRLLALDEPSLGLSPTAVDTVFASIAAIRERGTAVLLVEQRAQQAVAAADRTHVLSEGRITMTLGPEHANDSALLMKAYLGS